MTEWFEKYTGLLILGLTIASWALVLSLGVVRFVDADDMSDAFHASAPGVKARLAEPCATPVPPYAGQKVVDHVRRHWRSTRSTSQRAYNPRLLAKPEDRARELPRIIP
jgi:hypothetical protein